MKTFIIEKYENQNLNQFRGSWKSKFKKVAEELDYIVEKDDSSNIWPNIVVELKQKRKNQQSYSRSETSNSSTLSNRIITPDEKAQIIEFYSTIKEADKGTLSTGKKISDCMLNLAKDCVFEHPVHSYIFDTSDPVWDNYFTKEELKEAKAYNNKLRVDIPEQLQAYFATFEDKNLQTPNEYYNHALERKFPLGESFDERWTQADGLIESLYHVPMFPSKYSFRFSWLW